MSMIDTVRAEMVAALKEKRELEKSTYSLLLSALKNKSIDLRGQGKEMTADDEIAVVKREIKDCSDMLEELGKAGITSGERVEECRGRIAVLSKYMPAQLDAAAINGVIDEVLARLAITAPTAKDKGRIMKELMPAVKGRADGKLVNELLQARFA
mgnify:CR=1 FL=1